MVVVYVCFTSVAAGPSELNISSGGGSSPKNIAKGVAGNELYLVNKAL